MKSLRHKLSSVPSPQSGLALAIASLGLTWEAIIPSDSVVQHLSALLALLVLLPVVLKFVLSPSLLLNELKNPVAGAMLPVITMAIMVINASIADYHLGLALSLNVLAFCLQLALSIGFIASRWKDFSFAQMIPCWFIPPIGFVLLVLVSPVPLPNLLLTLILYGALLAYALLLPLIMLRLKSQQLPIAQRPILAIMATPASLILAGFLDSGLELNNGLILGLSVIAISMTIAVYIALFELIKLDFTPAVAAFTFPLVVSATALIKLHTYMQTMETSSTALGIIQALYWLELAIASAMLLYVIIRYLKFYSGRRLAKIP
ncbi:C4-dicarboxylate ABC transporter [Alginatibacterium sediminis]|uniref:C4-dicarboxylate ABC transporter n=1 Tax=Alginatibacterium sediminis TaxID=2164068 RepID=A0A420EBB8_9ALTE|nr:C4-dicarboxylate ABC transporter [Alginatibacterium sediminis]RKF17975.1 C4-dicarboxylate ABC transporter [Alginatibacterium sediminis]